MTREDALDAVIAKQAISDVMQRYCRTLDWLDDAGQASCFWPDAAIDYGFFTGTAEEFLPVVMAIERASQRRWHMLSQVSIRLHSDRHASAECYGMAAGVRAPDAGAAPASEQGEVGSGWSGNVYGGRYLDEFERRAHAGGDEWRISKRQYILDWQIPLVNQPSGEPNPDFPLPMLQILESGHEKYRVI